MKNHINMVAIAISALIAVGCNSGSSESGDGGGGSDNPFNSVVPNPYPPESVNYEPLPDGFESALPTFVKEASSAMSLQIAWGDNSNPAALDLAASVKMIASDRVEICSATPIYTPENPSEGTWLVGAAHCFVKSKSNPNIVSSNEILEPSSIIISKGVGGNATTPITFVSGRAAIYIQPDYCQGAQFNSLGSCPNFSPNEGVRGGQGNDIALIHINKTFSPGNESANPQIAESGYYPLPYTMAPILSLGYGNNNVVSDNGILFYVLNYFYEKSDDAGYHYNYNSYFNSNPGSIGYSSLICGGDSGGGDLFWDGSRWILLSEHTYGPSNACGQFYNYLPNGATNVSSYYEWLTTIIQSQDPVALCKNDSSNCVTNMPN